MKRGFNKPTVPQYLQYAEIPRLDIGAQNRGTWTDTYDCTTFTNKTHLCRDLTS